MENDIELIRIHPDKSMCRRSTQIVDNVDASSFNSSCSFITKEVYSIMPLHTILIDNSNNKKNKYPYLLKYLCHHLTYGIKQY
ncbi:hypothetical protein BLOT_012811 [Blomia tropicalis]|nr:hypothetical protein BLOT_012811 [Blomia tropicalis]